MNSPEQEWFVPTWIFVSVLSLLLLVYFVDWGLSLSSSTRTLRSQLSSNVQTLVRLQLLSRAISGSKANNPTDVASYWTIQRNQVKKLLSESKVYSKGKVARLSSMELLVETLSTKVKTSSHPLMKEAYSQSIDKTIRQIRGANAQISYQLGRYFDKLYNLVYLSFFIALVCVIFVFLFWYLYSQSLKLRSELSRSLTNSESAKEGALSANRAKSRFLATMSHEIRTPLHGIMGALNLLDKKSMPPQQQELAAVAQRSADTLLSMVNDVLDFSKIEAGAFTIHREVYCPKTVCIDTKDLLNLRAHDKGLRILLSKSPDVPQHVVGDFDRVRQVLINLVANAVKFTHRGTVEIRLALVEENNQKWISYAVFDEGPGLSDDEQKVVFQPFVQTESSQDQLHHGTGLGLSICMQIIKLMDGRIGVESEKGKGACFWFKVPLILPDPGMMDLHPTDSESSLSFVPTSLLSYKTALNTPLSKSIQTEESKFDSEHSPLHILVVEDNPINQQIIKIYLKRWGHTLKIAENGLQAINLVMEQSFDVVLMDCSLPIMDGLEATRRIREMQIPFSEVPIFALTARATKEEEKNCYEAGMNEFLTKPIDYNKLEMLLSKVDTPTSIRLDNPS